MRRLIITILLFSPGCFFHGLFTTAEIREGAEMFGLGWRTSIYQPDIQLYYLSYRKGIRKDAELGFELALPAPLLQFDLKHQLHPSIALDFPITFILIDPPYLLMFPIVGIRPIVSKNLGMVTLYSGLDLRVIIPVGAPTASVTLGSKFDPGRHIDIYGEINYCSCYDLSQDGIYWLPFLGLAIRLH